LIPPHHGRICDFDIDYLLLIIDCQSLLRRLAKNDTGGAPAVRLDGDKLWRNGEKAAIPANWPYPTKLGFFSTFPNFY